MASVKISVNELTAQKAVYTKAAKNVRDVLVTVKNARSMIGNDKMFENTRQSLGKMADRLEKRAEALEMLARLIDNATSSYKSAQKRSVTAISGLKAHKTDFYGNPVQVVATAGGAAIAGAATINITQNYYTTNVSSAAPSSAPTASSVPEAAAPAPAAQPAAETPVSMAEADIPAPASVEPVAVSEPYADAAPEAPAVEAVADIAQDTVPTAETPAAAPVAEKPVISAEAPEVSEYDNTPGVVGASIVGGGAILGAAAVGASDVISGKYKAGAQKRKIDKQLMEARRKMAEIESEEAQLKASLADNQNDT